MSDTYNTSRTRTATLPPTIDLLTQGMDCLVKNLGIVEAEAFITAVKRENFDYTRWHEEEFANGMSVEDVVQQAVAFVQKQ